MWIFIYLNISTLNRVKVMVYAQLWCAMVWYDKCESMRMYATMNGIKFNCCGMKFQCYIMNCQCYATYVMVYVVKDVL